MGFETKKPELTVPSTTTHVKTKHVLILTAVRTVQPYARRACREVKSVTSLLMREKECELTCSFGGLAGAKSANNYPSILPIGDWTALGQTFVAHFAAYIDSCWWKVHTWTMSTEALDAFVLPMKGRTATGHALLSSEHSRVFQRNHLYEW